MELLSQSVEQSELVRGDHIYSWRNIIYSHHGIFAGEGKVIHFVNPTKSRSFSFSAASSSSLSGTNCTFSYCGLEKVPGSGVKLSCINCFTKNRTVCRFKYQASHAFLFAKIRGGTCTTAKSDPPNEVMDRATFLHENGYIEYHFMNNNCEDFALYCKTGLWSNNINYQGRSSQANAVHPTSRSTEDNGAVEFILRMVTAVPRSFVKRESKDLGVRGDVVKVPVERLSTFILSLN